MCTRLLGAFAPFAVRQRDLSRDGSLSHKGYGKELPEKEVLAQLEEAYARGGKASPSVSIFWRAPLCSHTCRFFFLVSRTRHHSCAGHCFTIRSHCNFFRNATIPPGRIKQQRKTKQTATKQNQQRNTNQTQTENQTPEWKLSSQFLYNIQLK